jgi:hypothetical protein
MTGFDVILAFGGGLLTGMVIGFIVTLYLLDKIDKKDKP